MKSFVTSGGRAASPQNGPSNARSRAAIGANAKLHTGQKGRQNTGARRQSGTSVSRPPPNHLNSRRPQSGESHDGRRDRYDTDAESLDTTTHQSSVFQVQDSQRTNTQQPTQASDSDSGDDSAGESHVDESEISEPRRPGSEHFEESRQLYEHLHTAIGGFLGDGNSYPSTTSGPGEDLFDQRETGRGSPSEDTRYGAGRSLPQRLHRGNDTTTHVVHQPHQHQRSGNNANPSQQRPFNLFGKSAVAQDQQRTNTAFAARGGVGYDPTGATPSSHPPTYIRTDHEIAERTAAFSHPKPPLPAITLPSRDGRAPHGTSHFRPARSVQTAAPASHPAQLQHRQDLEPPQHHFEAPVEEFKPLIVEDYDRPALFQKTYDELRAENFDHIPRGQSPVLSGEIGQKAPEERIAHAYKHLNAENQDKFFRSLPAREWEDAGDWFLGQFSDIVQRTREARQKKRKLARSFEDEVEKRYHHIAKRQQHVQDALDQMKTQGQSLITRSPHTSKSPKKT